MFKLFSAIFVFLYSSCLVSGAYTDAAATKLLVDLRERGYESAIIPENVTLQISLAIVDAEYDPETGLLHVTAWERYSWVDKRLAWDPDYFGGLQILRIPDTEVWTPDIRLYNAYRDSSQISPVNAVLDSNGSVTWVPPSVFSVRCHKLPDDESLSFRDGDSRDGNTIQCKLKYGSWSYDGFMLDLRSDNSEVDLQEYTPYGDAVIISSKAEINTSYYDCCEEPYDSYVATLYLRIKNKDQKFRNSAAQK